MKPRKASERVVPWLSVTDRMFTPLSLAMGLIPDRPAVRQVRQDLGRRRLRLLAELSDEGPDRRPTNMLFKNGGEAASDDGPPVRVEEVE